MYENGRICSGCASHVMTPASRMGGDATVGKRFRDDGKELWAGFAGRHPPATDTAGRENSEISDP